MHLAVGVVQDPGSLREVNEVDVFSTEFGDDLANIGHLRQRLKQWNHLEKATIIWVIVPRENRHGVFVMEVVRIRRVVYDDHIFHITAEQAQIFNV